MARRSRRPEGSMMDESEMLLARIMAFAASASPEDRALFDAVVANVEGGIKQRI
jgi:hypothetical protein